PPRAGQRWLPTRTGPVVVATLQYGVLSAARGQLPKSAREHQERPPLIGVRLPEPAFQPPAFPSTARAHPASHGYEVFVRTARNCVPVPRANKAPVESQQYSAAAVERPHAARPMLLMLENRID